MLRIVSVLSAVMAAGAAAQDFQAGQSSQHIDNGSCLESRATFGSVLRVSGYLEPGRGCSAVLNSPTVVFTFANCLPCAQSSTVTWRMHMQRRATTETPCIAWWSSDNTCVGQIIDYVKHPDYDAGSLYTENDIAVLQIRNNALRWKEGSIENNHFARLYNDVLHQSKQQKLTGFGSCKADGDWPYIYREVARDIDEGDVFDISFTETSMVGKTICTDDSCRPAFYQNQHGSQPLVVGFKSDYTVSGRCANSGGRQRFTSISLRHSSLAVTLDYTKLKGVFL